MTNLTSFKRPIQALVIGASGSIGGALVDALAASPSVSRVTACARTTFTHASRKVTCQHIDILDEASIVAALAGTECVDLAIVATGLLHKPGGIQPEKTWRHLDKAALLESYAANAVGPALVAKHVLPLLPRTGKAVFAAISARVGSISDNRLGGWHAYRASKAALNQHIRTLGIELARQRQDALCVGLHPGTVDSALSQPFQSGVVEGRLFTPAFAAERLLTVIDELNATHNGQLVAWDGKIIPP